MSRCVAYCVPIREIKILCSNVECNPVLGNLCEGTVHIVSGGSKAFGSLALVGNLICLDIISVYADIEIVSDGFGELLHGCNGNNVFRAICSGLGGLCEYLVKAFNILLLHVPLQNNSISCVEHLEISVGAV